jgi:hypothetical protein
VANREINPIFLIVGAALVLGVVIFIFYRASSPPTPPPGSYTPGIPPWMDKNRPAQTQQGVRQVPSAPQGR